MSFTHDIPCDRCAGTGWEPTVPQLDGTPTPISNRPCTSCLGQGHVRQNPPEAA